MNLLKNSLSSSPQNVSIVKNENERLGMHIKGGLNGQKGNPLDPADEGVFVSKINSSGAARRDGRLKVSYKSIGILNLWHEINL